jgi:hypothetical protein
LMRRRYQLIWRRSASAVNPRDFRDVEVPGSYLPLNFEPTLID